MQIVGYCHEECIYKVKPVGTYLWHGLQKFVRVSEQTNPEMSASSSHQLHSACSNQLNLILLTCAWLPLHGSVVCL